MKVFVNKTLKRVLALFLAVLTFFGVVGMREWAKKPVLASTTGAVERVTADPTAPTVIEQTVLKTEATETGTPNATTAEVNTPATISFDKTYTKVTEVPADWSGEYLIVYEVGNLIFDGSLATLDAVSNYQSVTITNETITGDNKQYSFTIVAVDGGYSIQAASGKYIGNTSNSNALTSSDTALVNTISLNDDNSVNIVGSGGAYLRYNSASNQTRFRYYKSSSYTSQKAIALYKLDEATGETPAPDCEHTWGAWVETVTPECEKNGEETRTCSTCQDVETRPIPATGHKYVDGVCSNSNCGEAEPVALVMVKVTDVSTLKVGDKLIIVAADSDYALSTTQNENNRGQATIVKSNDTITVEENSDVQVITLEAGTVAGTFAFNVGELGYLYAASSGSNYLRSETTLSDNSSWTVSIDSEGVATVTAQGNYTRNVMQYNSSNKIFSCYGSASQKAIAIYQQCKHSAWSEVDGTKVAPTCTVDGSVKMECAACGKEKDEVLPAGHTWGDVEIITPATCTTTGLEAKKCSVCGEEEDGAEIPALGHHLVLNEEAYVAPDCETKGFNTYECDRENCDYTENEEIAPLGHNFDGELTNVTATCTKAGTADQACTNEGCSETNSVSVPATGHTYNAENVCEICGEKAEVYVKVTEASADWSGKYLIVYEGENSVVFDGSLSALDVGKNGVGIEIVDNTIVANNSIANSYFTIVAVEGGYSIQSASGYYIGRTDKSNGMNVNDGIQYVNTIGLDGENATIQGAESGTWCLQYNKTDGVNGLRFRFYESGKQQAIALYKLEESAAEPPAGEVSNPVEAFEALRTKASFSLTYNEDNTVNVAKLTFGMKMEAALYEQLDALGAKFGVYLTCNGAERTMFDDNKQPVRVNENGKADENGDYYQLVGIIGVSNVWTKEVTGEVFMEIEGQRYNMVAVTYSVHSLADELLAELEAGENTEEYTTRAINALKEMQTPTTEA